jgi:hypothetical protein
MDRERAETYLRLLAEAELRRARVLHAAGIRRPQNSAGLALVAPALVAVGAVDAGTAVQIRADLELAVAGREPGQENHARLMRGFSGRAGTTVALDQVLSTGHARPAPHRASWRAVPVGQVIHFRDGDVRHELLVVAYLRSAGGARFIMAGWPFRPLTAADDRGARYHIVYHGGPGVAEFLLTPDPPRQIRWLDLITAPGEPATRIDLDPPITAPYSRVVRPLPTLWVRDSSGRWHATGTDFTMPSGNSGEVVLWLRIVPPLDRDTTWIDLVATGRSAEVRVRLPLSWTAAAAGRDAQYRDG